MTWSIHLSGNDEPLAIYEGKHLMDLHTAQQSLIFETVAGSHAYGTNTPASDRDLRGVFTLPASHYLRMNKPPEQASDERNDTTYYSLHRFLSLASDANPNILELLFMPTDCIQKTSSLWEEIVRHRHLFISKRVLRMAAMRWPRSRRPRGRTSWFTIRCRKLVPSKRGFVG